MNVDVWSLIWWVALLGLWVLGPPICLFVGWTALRARRYGPADTWATLAGIGSWILLGFEGLFVLLAVAMTGSLPGNDPLGMAALGYPPAVWWFARALRRSVARHRQEDIDARRNLREEVRERAADEKRKARDADPGGA